jgi:hypothetical protein
MTLEGYTAQPSRLYQVDIILFTHESTSKTPTEFATVSILRHSIKNAISLNSTNALHTPYHLLPSNASQLNSEYWTLNRKSEYRVLAHYSWLQPHNNQRPIILPNIDKNGLHVEGTIRIRQSNYYLMDTAIYFSTKTNQQQTFVLSHQQRLKGGVVYYIDHPKVGMLIKIHQAA